MSDSRSIFLVAGRTTPTNERLLEAFRRLGLDARRLDPVDAPVAATEDDLVLGRLDVRPTLDGVDHGLDVLEWFVRRRFDVLNPPDALLAAHDKLQTALRLGRFRIPHPRTAHVDCTAPLPDLGFGFPAVVKPRFGSWGRDVELCRSAGELRRCIRRLRRRSWFRRQGALLQEYVPTRGRDLRLVVAAGEVVGAVERRAVPGEWRSNVALGGTRHGVEPPPEAIAAALAAVSAVGLELAGVDLLPLQGGGWTVLEVNGAVDFTDDYSLAGRHVFDAAASSLLADGDGLVLPSGREGARVAPTGV